MTASSIEPRARRAGNAERRELRRYFRDQRRRLPPAEQRSHAEAVTRHFFAHGLVTRGRTLALYFANEADGELSTAPLLSRLMNTRKRLALPVVGRGGRMTLHRYGRGTPLAANRFGILEPAAGARCVAPLSVDLIMMPLVAFDDFGVRLGMGAGYYDRYLGAITASLRPRLIGLAHEAQRSLDPLPFAEWDVPLHGVITEAGWQTFDN